MGTGERRLRAAVRPLSSLLSPMATTRTLRLAATADLHYHRHAAGTHRALFEAASAEADVLLLCGDLTDYGLKEEAEVLAEDLRTYCSIPVLAVLGNHDYEAGHPEAICEALDRVHVQVLDGSVAVVDGVGFAGVKGFGGGFGRYALSAWGEPTIKAFVQAAVDDALRLDAALSRLDTEYEVEHRVVLLHYAPIAETVAGEPEVIYPFCGSSRLEDPLNRYDVAAVFHGHAHAGAPEGKTTAGVPVYNVGVPVLRRAFPDHPPFRVVELELRADEEDTHAEASAANGRSAR
ncbi:MAG TPA: metallophosphoesterase [Rubricoccaceae bacterium]|nr:metallophosphoesterase [Rubricoccaceae bacterium]